MILKDNTLELQNIDVTYGKFKAVDDISLSLKPGVYGLIGPNGSGKTSLINAITTLIKTSKGSIHYQAENISSNTKEYRNKIGLMPQNLVGYGNYNAGQFLYYIASLKGYKKNDAKKEIDYLVAKVGLQNDLNKKIKAYSGGMRQRLMFIQAVLGSPEILILDEPTAGLDPMERIRMRRLISSFSKDTIVIYATHVMQDIESIANEIIFIQKGKLIKKASPSQCIEELKGHVIEERVDFDRLSEIEQTYKCTNVIKVDEWYYVRYLDETPTDSEVIPNLEDVYLHYLGAL